MNGKRSAQKSEQTKPANEKRVQKMPATPAPRDDDVRQGDLAGSREYANQLDKDLQGDEYIVGLNQDDGTS
jgi:hypothetical protein